MKKYNVAVIGATGNTGRAVLSIMSERNFPIDGVYAAASPKSIGKAISFGEKETIKVSSMDEIGLSKVDICFFCAGSNVSKKYVQIAAKKGATVIDKTSHFRLLSDVPLIIPEVNGDILKNGAPAGIISNPNCVATPIAMAMKPIHDRYKIKRVVISTYQSVSGAGKNAMDELYYQTKSAFSGTEYRREVFSKNIAFNVIPEIGNRLQNGNTDEEDKISREILKIFKGDIKVAVTCVRVPVFIGHSMSVACELSSNVNMCEVVDLLSNFSGISVIDRNDTFMTPVEAQNEDEVFISRIRKDDTVKSGILFWVVSDNLRKGAALNGVQIAEKIIELDPSLKIFKHTELR